MLKPNLITTLPPTHSTHLPSFSRPRPHPFVWASARPEKQKAAHITGRKGFKEMQSNINLSPQLHLTRVIINLGGSGRNECKTQTIKTEGPSHLQNPETCTFTPSSNYSKVPLLCSRPSRAALSSAGGSSHLCTPGAAIAGAAVKATLTSQCWRFGGGAFVNFDSVPAWLSQGSRGHTNPEREPLSLSAF